MTLKQKATFIFLSVIVNAIFIYWVYSGDQWQRDRCNRPEVQCEQ